MRYLLVGDSQAAGPPGAALEAALRREGHEVARVAAVGQGVVSWYLTRRGEVEGLARQADRVVGLFGSNDAADHPRLRQALAWWRSLGAWYSGPPQYRDASRRRLGAALRVVIREQLGSRYLDVWTATGDPACYAPDGIHLRPCGGEAWAGAVVDQLPSSVPWLALGVLGAAALTVGVVLGRRA